ncbi:MAG: hypothetical protein R3E39_09305 [Anaerolineae bacterium]
MTPKRKGFLWLALPAVLLAAQPPTLPAPQAERLQGCRELGVTAQAEPNIYDWRYGLASPDGTYVVEGHHLGSHGCHDIQIFKCPTRQSSPHIGCDGIFPPESPDVVFVDKWLSDSELLITRAGESQVIDASGYFEDGQTQLPVPDQELGLSPDGQWKLFHSWRDGMPELYRSHPDGTDAQRLTVSQSGETFYGWSPDKQWLIFDYSPPDQPRLPYRMHLDGTEFAPLITQAGDWQTLAFSPDSQWLLVQDYAPDGSDNSLNLVIYRLHIPDGVLTRLTDPHTSYWFVDWSPHGEVLTFHWLEGSELRRYDLFDLKTGSMTSVFTGEFAEFEGWENDGANLLFSVYWTSDDKTHWYRASANGLTVEEVAPQK